MATFFKPSQTPEDAFSKACQNYEQNLTTLKQVAAAHSTPAIEAAAALVQSQLKKLDNIQPTIEKTPDSTPRKL